MSDREQEAFRLMNSNNKTSYVKYNRINQILDPVNKTEKTGKYWSKIKEAFLPIDSNVVYQLYEAAGEL